MRLSYIYSIAWREMGKEEIGYKDFGEKVKYMRAFSGGEEEMYKDLG